MVGVRGPVYLAAGVVRMPFRQFLLWDLVAATAVVGSFFGLSFYFGRDIARLLRDAELTLTVVAVAVVIVIAIVALRRRRARRLQQLIDKAALESANEGDAREAS